MRFVRGRARERERRRRSLFWPSAGLDRALGARERGSRTKDASRAVVIFFSGPRSRLRWIR